MIEITGGQYKTVSSSLWYLFSVGDDANNYYLNQLTLKMTKELSMMLNPRI